MKTLNGPHKYVFTDEQITYLRDNWRAKTNKQLAEGLGLALTIVRMQLYSMGYKRMELEYWTDEQVAYLRANYKEKGDKELAEEFTAMWAKAKGWRNKHIEKKRRYLGLKRTQAEKDAILTRNIARGCYLDTTTWATRGEAPVGTLKTWLVRTNDGETSNYYVHIKLKDGYVHYARWLWVQVYGDPGELIVTFKDGDQLNTKIDNLMVITRAQSATRSSKGRLPQELREVKELSKQLNKLIQDGQAYRSEAARTD